MAMFFSGKFTQNGFNIVAELIQLFMRDTNVKIPQNFNQCTKSIFGLFDDKVKYKKTLYCSKCNKTFNNQNRFLKKCDTCANQ